MLNRLQKQLPYIKEDFTRSFYNKVDETTFEHKLSHTCRISDFKESAYGDDLNKLYFQNHKDRSFDKIGEDYESLYHIANSLLLSQRFEEAGKAYIRVAEFAFSNKIDFWIVINRLDEAAECFLMINNCLAFHCSMRAANIYLKNGCTEKGIEHCVRWGYKFASKFGNHRAAEAFYNKADKIRHEHKLSHNCVITQFKKSDYGDDVNELHDDIEKSDCHHAQM
ncbi:hypothetical protein RF11_13250 [Thelohanellus kitauei]|uniref:Uncharacterized protein n=1 Tax=Thelohanellus kitauei TaxID=669202 RepID=A0A0C2IU43_THEKT|nr:hypothetical protein RF11_13250 [Thelohanellus kitauei]